MNTVLVQRLSLAVLLVIVVSAVGLRLYGLGWDSGYPYSPHPDERAMLYAVERISLDSTAKNLNPQWFAYGSLPIYVNFFAIELLEKIAPFNLHSDGRLFGRTLAALAGLGVAVYFYLATVGFLGRRWSLFGVALLLFSVLHVQIGHFLTVDALLCFFIMGALYSLNEFIKKGSFKKAIIVGVWIGLGVATKLTALLILPVVCVSLFLFALKARENTAITTSFFRLTSVSFLRGFLILLTAGIVVVVCQPFMLVDWAGFVEDVVTQGKMVVREIDFPYTRQYIKTAPYIYNIWHLMVFGLGLPLGLLSLAGVVFVFQRLTKRLSINGVLFFLLSFIVPAIMLILWGGILVKTLAISLHVFLFLLSLYKANRHSVPVAVVLFFTWTLSYFLFVGSLEVKFVRYMAPVVPPFIALGVFALKTLACHHDTRRFKRTLAYMVAGGVLLCTGVYAIAFSSIYGGEEHPGVAMSKWIRANVPERAVILSEHWEEPIPYLVNYTVQELPVYEEDTPQKVASLSSSLAKADYIVFYSNRLYGTIPRLRERYPLTSTYYRALFDGRLGFSLINTEEKRISLFCVNLFEDTFSAAGLDIPATYPSKEGCVSINVGKTDESFSVYDHPRAMLFKKDTKLTQKEISSLLINANHQQSVLAEYASQSSEMSFFKLKLTNNDEIAATVRWILLFVALSVLGLPFVFKLFENLPARGVFFSKHLSLLLFCVLVWLLASTKLANFTKDAIYIAGALFATLSLVLYVFQWNRIVLWFKKELATILISECLFLFAFIAFLFIRMANPDLWHPYLGGEKPMEMAYLSATMRSPFMPPYDPWFAGEHLNYYYWGYFLVGTLGNLLKIAPVLLFNLAVPSFFALTLVGSFGIGHAIAGTWLGRGKLKLSVERSSLLKWPVFCGGIVAVLVVVIGNLDGAIQVVQNSVGCLFVSCEGLLKEGAIVFDFWKSSRVMAPDPPGFEITEFPFFTFLFGDLHPHMMALPFTLLSLCILFSLFLKLALSRVLNKTTVFLSCGVLGVSIGALRVLNTWDYPVYLLLAAVVLFFANYIRNGGFGLNVIFYSIASIFCVFGFGYLVFLPFHLTYTFPLDPNGLLPIIKTTNTTTAVHFATIYGLFFVITAAWVLSEILTKNTFPVLSKVWANFAEFKKYPAVIFLAVFAGTLLWWVSLLTGETVVIVFPLLCLLSILLFQAIREAASNVVAVKTFIFLVLGAALLGIIGVEFFRLENDIDRMNTVFKAYMQVWVLFGIVAGVFLWRYCLESTRFSALKKRTVFFVLGLLLLGSLVYPVLGTHKRLAVRFDTTHRLTLNGAEYMDTAVYRDPSEEIRLSHDKDAIDWMLVNFKGLPVVAEAVTPIYRWGSRISIYTGFPTVIGWNWHQQQQRIFSHKEIQQRARDVELLYLSKEQSLVKEIIKKYDIEYVILGKVEKIYYYSKGNSFLDAAISSLTVPVYENGEVKILSTNFSPID
tara:strand:+ start:22129 stop:26523 length:4395 start_codon:yes stop_codon:yes gene_type:complete